MLAFHAMELMLPGRCFRERRQELNQRMPDNQGNVYIVKLKDFRKTFPIGDREPTDDEIKLYVIEAYLEQSLGGDFIKTSIVAI